MGVEDRRFVFRVFRGVGLGHGGAAFGRVRDAAGAELPRAGASRAVRIAGRRELVLPGAGRGVQGTPGLVPGFLPGCGGLTGGGVGVTSTVTGAGTVASWVVVRVVVPSVLAGIVGVVSLVDVLAVLVATVSWARPGARASPPGPASTLAASRTKRMRRRVMRGRWVWPQAPAPRARAYARIGCRALGHALSGRYNSRKPSK